MKSTAKTSKQRSIPKMIMGCLLLVLGVAVLLYPIIGNQIAQWHRRQAVEEFIQEMNQITEADRQHYLELARQYNEFIYNWQQGQPHEVISYEEIGYQMGRTLGTLDIPALNIRAMPFYHGSSYETLMRGLGHFEQSSFPIGGESTRGVITGHSGIQNQLLFTEIKRLQVGDIFFVNILGERLAYEIESFDTVLPTETNRVRIRSGVDMVTLLTCTPPGINTYRLLVNGFRIPYEEAIAREIIIRNQWSYQMVVLGSLGLGALLLILCAIRYRMLKKVTTSENQIKKEKGTRKLKHFLRGVKVLFFIFLGVAIVILGFATYGFFRMQGEVPLGPMNIGVIEDEDSGMSREDLLSQRNRLRVITANYDEGQIASVTASTYAGAMLDTLDTVNDWGIGRLLLPDVEMDLPILAGIANVNLVTGGSTYRMNQQLGECNYVLLAHSVYGNHNVLFQPLEFVQLGQRIYATDFLNVYTYEVTFNQVVLHDQVELLDQLGEEETPIITLMRCEGGIGTIHRRIVQGELVNVEPLESEGMARFNLIEDASDTRSQESETRNGNPEGALEENQEERTVGDNLPPLLMNHPISKVELLSVEFAARILSDPVQVALPLFLFLLFPMLFLSMLPSQPKGNKRKKEEDEVIEEMMKQLMEKIE